MGDLDWRCAAAQSFVGGQITRIDGYWQSHVLGANIYELIDEYGLWQDAFGGSAQEIEKKWRSMLALRNQPRSIGRLAKAAFGNLRGKNKEVRLGTELLDALKHDVVMPLQRLFHSASLTINFNARGWFRDQAGFDSYVTMWDRKTTGVALTKNQDPLNPADTRAKADRWAMYGQFDDGKQHVTGAGMHLPHVKGHEGTFFYSIGKKGDRAQPSEGNPTDSQVFAALNYGKRINGSSLLYGRSFFQLSEKYKANAIYFAMDTFYPLAGGAAKPDRQKLYQVSASWFGGGILLAIKSQNPVTNFEAGDLLRDLITAARGVGMPKDDTDLPNLLIEAHLFNKVAMNSQCVQRVYISRKECPHGTPMVGNVRAFSQRTGIPVTWTP